MPTHKRLAVSAALASVVAIGLSACTPDTTRARVEHDVPTSFVHAYALSEQLQRQVLERELDGALALAPNRLPGLGYTHVLDDRLWVCVHQDHPLAARSELTLADLAGERIVLLGGPAGRSSGFNRAVRALFDGNGIQPRVAETPQVYPPRAALDAGYMSVTVPVDFPEGVVRIPLVPPRTLPFYFVQRAETNRSTVRAFARFAAEQLPALCADDIAPS